MGVWRRRGIKWIASLLIAFLTLGTMCAGLVLLRIVERAEMKTAATEAQMPGVEAQILPPHLPPELIPSRAPAATAVPQRIERSAAETVIEQEIEDTSELEDDEEWVNPHADEGMRIEPLFQRNYRETVARVGGRARTVSSSGCGAVCVSMVVSYLTGDWQQTPETQFMRAVERGEYAGMGLVHETLSALLDECGVQNEWIPNTVDGIAQALREGKPVIAHLGPGTFTRNGHYVLLRGFADDGQVLVNDPASPERTAKTYPIEIFVRQARREDCFLVCWMDSAELAITSFQAVSVDESKTTPSAAQAPAGA